MNTQIKILVLLVVSLLTSCAPLPIGLKKGLEVGTAYDHEYIPRIIENYKKQHPSVELNHLQWYVVDREILNNEVCNNGSEQPVDVNACIFIGYDVVFIGSHRVDKANTYHGKVQLAGTIAHEMLHDVLDQLEGDSNGEHDHPKWETLYEYYLDLFL